MIPIWVWAVLGAVVILALVPLKLFVVKKLTSSPPSSNDDADR